jgi:hypothetical protein
MDGARAKSASAQCDGRGSCASLTKLVADLDDLLSSGTENILYPSGALECSVWRTGSHTGAAVVAFLLI